MHISVPLKTQAGETRVAATPETIKKLIDQGHRVTVQSGAGGSASIPESAIDTAKRLGAVIEASDVHLAAKKRIESLGAKFVAVPFETDEERDCARPMPASWMERRAKEVHEPAKQADMVIATALIWPRSTCSAASC